MRKLVLLTLVAGVALSFSACSTTCPQGKEPCRKKNKVEKKATGPQADTRSVFQKLDGKDQDGIITDAEYTAQRKAWFKQLDADKNDKLAKDEYGEASLVIMDIQDHDGAISEEEWMLFFVGPEVGDTWTSAEAKEQPGSCFKAMDQNGDGKVTKEEFVVHRKGWFKQIDADHDGKIGKAEFKKMRHDEHAFRDTDKDGVLVLEELVVVSPVAPSDGKSDKAK